MNDWRGMENRQDMDKRLEEHGESMPNSSYVKLRDQFPPFILFYDVACTRVVSASAAVDHVTPV